MTYSPVPELNLLMDLQERLGPDFSYGFSLIDFGDNRGAKAGWSSEPEFLDRLLTFARANDTGSQYALWRIDDRTDLATLPVVVLGDEGGEFAVARNLREFFQLLTYDTELSIYPWRLPSFRDHVPDDEEAEVYEPGAEILEYIAWLEKYFGLGPITDPAAIIAAADAEFGVQFREWFTPFGERFLANLQQRPSQ